MNLCVRKFYTNRQKFVCHPRNSRERDGEKLISIQYRMDRMYKHKSKEEAFLNEQCMQAIWDLISHCYHIFDFFFLSRRSCYIPLFMAITFKKLYAVHMQEAIVQKKNKKKTFQINLLIASRRIEILRENKSGWQEEVGKFLSFSSNMICSCVTLIWAHKD